MASGMEMQAGRTVVQAALRLAGRFADARRREQLRNEARPLIPVEVADRLLGELDPAQLAGVARYLGSPDFEHLAIQLILAESEDAHSAVREQLRYGLRHAADLPPDILLGITDVFFDGLVAACRTVPTELGVALRNTTLVAATGHVAAMAARNGALLRELHSLAKFHRAADRLRNQVAALHAELRLPHTGASRSVPWPRLYVEPSLVSERQHGQVPPVADLTNPGQRTVILGDPGAGKSTLAAKLAHDVGTDDSHRVPFLVVLRELSEALHRGERTLVEHLTAVARVPYNVELAVEAAEYLLLNGRAVVILDGLDELTDPALRRRVADLVESFVRLHPLVPLVVTSRLVGYAEASLNPSLFDRCLIAPFNEDQVAAYARNWFTLDDAAAPNVRDRLCRSFLRESQTIDDLRRNPLLLSLLCAMYATEQFIPRNRADVYEKCAVMMFERWDSMRGVRMPVQFHGRVRGAVQELAWQMFAESEVSELPRAKVLRTLVGFLRGKGFDEDDAVALAEDFLVFCTGRAWVLAEVGTTETEPIYGFAHRTFLEYFAAERLVRRNPSPEAVWRMLAPRVVKYEWEVVAQLALQLLDRNIDDGAERLLTLALDSLPEDRSRAAGVVEFVALATGQVGLSPAMTARIVNAAVDLSNTCPPVRRHCFWVGSTDLEVTRTVDRPLRVLQHESLQGDLPLIERALAIRLEADCRRDDDFAFSVAHDLGLQWPTDDVHRVDFWRRFQVRLRDECRSHWRAWERRSPFGALSRLKDSDPSQIAEFLTRFGVAPLYLVRLFFGALVFPTTLNMLVQSHPAVHVLRDHLLRRPTPWIGSDRWWDEYEKLSTRAGIPWVVERVLATPWPESGPDLATFLVLYLPYLETYADRPKPSMRLVPSSGAAAWLVRARGAWKERASLPGDLEDRDIPEDCAEFLVRWAAREVSVIG